MWDLVMKYRKTIIIFSIVFLFFFSCAAMFYEIIQFSIYESEHFTFFCIQGSRVEDNIKKITRLSEKAVRWTEDIFNINIDLKIDGYMFDNNSMTAYSRLIDDIDTGATVEVKAGFQFIYKDAGYDNALSSEIILHETFHVVQLGKLFLYNIGMMEGHAFYVESAYRDFGHDDSINYENAFIFLKSQAREGLEISDDYPHKIFSMTPAEFHKIDIGNLNRESNYRYEIGASFISYLVKEYGLNKLYKWFYKTDRYNYVANFRKAYPIDFYTAEEDWYKELYSR